MGSENAHVIGFAGAMRSLPPILTSHWTFSSCRENDIEMRYATEEAAERNALKKLNKAISFSFSLRNFLSHIVF